jgi:hypothetical protein
MDIQAEMNEQSLQPELVLNAVDETYFRLRIDGVIKPSEAILGGKVSLVVGMCEIFAGEEVVNRIKVTIPGIDIRVVKTSGHTFMETGSEMNPQIIDPTALQFFEPETIPAKYLPYFMGTMFMGPKKVLNTLVHDPAVSIVRSSNISDRDYVWKKWTEIRTAKSNGD